MNTPHIAAAFDRDLESMQAMLTRMGGLVEQQVERAMDGLASGEVFVIDQVIANDDRVNLLEVLSDVAHEALRPVMIRRSNGLRDKEHAGRRGHGVVSTDSERVVNRGARSPIRTRPWPPYSAGGCSCPDATEWIAVRLPPKPSPGHPAAPC